MDADYDIQEIVKVIPDFWLIDPESYQRSYCTNNGNPLVPGYYVVAWPEAIRVRRFDGQAVFHGSFESRLQAQAFLNTMKKYKYQLILLPDNRTVPPLNANQLLEKKVA
jgi:hypothetical protein